jgi:pseudaminic acid CMP-transferase|tara:strand:- start:8123 stop:8818 length:696 start_codon:yes stop_codon:yes gene_type:complete
LKNIAIIPARGGSKRIPKKNIREFCGKPMISWTIKEAKKSKLFDEIVVSTEDREIADIAKEYGATIPFNRPIELADDFSTTHSVVLHGIKSLLNLSWDFDMVCCLYPCSPFITYQDLIATYNLLKENNSLYVYPVTPYSHPIQRAMSLSSNNKLEYVDRANETTRTQDLETRYHDTGQFYWGSKDLWLTTDKIHSNAVGYAIPASRVVDIDEPDDWKLAELLFNRMSNQKP